MFCDERRIAIHGGREREPPLQEYAIPQRKAGKFHSANARRADTARAEEPEA
jgi:hypothetical protein